MLLGVHQYPDLPVHVTRRAMTALSQYSLKRQRGEIGPMKRESWNEEDLARLPAEEPDNFDRKSGTLFKDTERFLTAVAKAISAFANSGAARSLLGWPTMEP